MCGLYGLVWHQPYKDLGLAPCGIYSIGTDVRSVRFIRLFGMGGAYIGKNRTGRTSQVWRIICANHSSWQRHGGSSI